MYEVDPILVWIVFHGLPSLHSDVHFVKFFLCDLFLPFFAG